jgi:protein-disulfide isomerase
MSEQPNPVAKPVASVPDLQHRLRRSQRLNVALGLVAAFLVVVVAAQQLGSGVAPAASPSASGSAGKSLAAQVARNQPNDPMAWGDINAPVVMVQWTDFRCPFCAAFAKDTLPTLYADYIDTGKVRFEVHDVAYFGDQSVDAAVAARAAGEQGKYHGFMSVLYAAAPASGHPDLPKAKLISFAEQANVPDIAKFTDALGSAELRKLVTDSTLNAQKQGVSGVPFFLIGSQVVDGAQPLLKFKSTIEAELAKS